MKSSLFTIIFEYAGGTYVDQVCAQTALLALRHWSKKNKLPKSTFNTKQLACLVDIIKSLESVLKINDMRNVWCQSFILNNQLGLINVVKTYKSVAGKGSGPRAFERRFPRKKHGK
jgi:hypothetical protein